MKRSRRPLSSSFWFPRHLSVHVSVSSTRDADVGGSTTWSGFSSCSTIPLVTGSSSRRRSGKGSGTDTTHTISTNKLTLERLEERPTWEVLAGLDGGSSRVPLLDCSSWTALSVWEKQQQQYTSSNLTAPRHFLLYLWFSSGQWTLSRWFFECCRGGCQEIWLVARSSTTDKFCGLPKQAFHIVP